MVWWWWWCSDLIWLKFGLQSQCNKILLSSKYRLAWTSWQTLSPIFFFLYKLLLLLYEPTTWSSFNIGHLDCKQRVIHYSSTEWLVFPRYNLSCMPAHYKFAQISIYILCVALFDVIFISHEQHANTPAHCPLPCSFPSLPLHYQFTSQNTQK